MQPQGCILLPGQKTRSIVAEIISRMEGAFFFFFFLYELRQRVDEELRSTQLSISELFHKLSGGNPHTVDVFISYSYRDDPILPLGLYLLLRDEHCASYLPLRFLRGDGRDPTLKAIQETRDIISISKTLILLDGPQTTRSQWIPWEVGYVAGRTGKVATFTATENKPATRNREFLKLYPTIARERDHLVVASDHGRKIGIHDWVSSTT